MIQVLGLFFKYQPQGGYANRNAKKEKKLIWLPCRPEHFHLQLCQFPTLLPLYRQSSAASCHSPSFHASCHSEFIVIIVSLRLIYFTVAVAQMVRASDCGSEGRGFDPHQPPGGKAEAKQDSPLCLFLGSAALRHVTGNIAPAGLHV